jgi:protein ImuB
MARIACILVADFPVAAIVRANPELRDRPVALSAGCEGHAELTAVSACARTSGVRSGMTIAQARALVSELIPVAPSPAAERSAHDAILDAAESFSPIVEDGGPGCAYLDLAGLAKIHGTEEQMAAELARRAAKVGIEAAIGIASSKEVAWLAARCGGQRAIPACKEREFLDWMPLDVLATGVLATGAVATGADDPDGAELVFTLARWGIRRLGELARIEPCALGSRLGARGVELARLARGENNAPFVPRPRAELFAEIVELDYGIEMLEPLGFVMRPMVERLAARMELRGLVAGDLQLSLGLDGCGVYDRRVAIAAPTNEVRSLLALIILSLEATPPSTAIGTIRITAEPRVPRPAQTDMFLPPSPAPDRLQTTIARLAAICGPDRVGTLKPVNSWRPEAIEVLPFDPPPPCSPPILACSSSPLPDQEPVLRLPKEEAARASRARVRVYLPPEKDVATNIARLVIRAIRPAEEVEVMCTRGGVPEFVRGRTVCARVVSISGPWRREGEWWLDRTLACDYYDVALADGAVYRMFCDLRSNQWFVDGLYD